MIIPIWQRVLLVIAAHLWSFSPSLAGSSESAVPYEMSARPVDKLIIVGMVPKNIAIELVAFWQATIINDRCANKMPVGTYLPKHQYLPKHVILPVPLEERVDDLATWSTWRDLLRPGACGWQLSSIEFKADTSMNGLSAQPETSPWSRISLVCLRDCVPNSANINDDPSEPVHQYCKFSLLRHTDGMWNPCIFESDGKMWLGIGTPGKSQHILRTEQHEVRFALTDLEASESKLPADPR